MGTVIPVDFKRRRTHPRGDQAPKCGMPGETVAVAVCVACLACLHAPLLLWHAWLPSIHPQPARPRMEAEEI
jgi:hypothetical protein